jgi:hypothetical protein
VNTNWGTELPWYTKCLVRVIQPLGASPADCAEFMCLPLLAPDAGRQTGLLLINSSGEPAKKRPEHEKAREIVWQHTGELLSRFGLPK